MSARRQMEKMIEDVNPWHRIGRIFIMNPITHQHIIRELADYIGENQRRDMPLNPLRRSLADLLENRFQEVHIHLTTDIPVGYVDYTSNIKKTLEKWRSIHSVQLAEKKEVQGT